VCITLDVIIIVVVAAAAAAVTLALESIMTPDFF
jgi:hypothetical protein